MRVLLFRNLCDRGGVSSSMLLLGREMEKRGIGCEYWFLKGSDRLPDFEATGRVTVAPLSALAARLERGGVDVVQMTASDPAAEVVSMMARVTPAKVLVTARGALADIWDRTNCFAYSAISKGMATVNQPYTDVEIEVVRNAIDVERFTPGPAVSGGAPIVAFVGRTSDAIKDFPRFTRIARRLVDRGARVWIADPHKAGWEHFAGKPVERIDAERWGKVPHEEIPDFYRAVAASGGVVVMTSKTEGFGTVAPEAAACGAWVVAPDVMGLNEAIIDGVTGNLFPADASDDEASELIAGRMAQRRDENATSEAARREFGAGVMMDGYEAIYARTEQRLHAAPSPRFGAGQHPHLEEHLAKQRTWRAAAAREAAIGLAGDGRTQLAIGALGIAFRAEPSQFLRGQGFRQLLSTVRRLPRRRARL